MTLHNLLALWRAAVGGSLRANRGRTGLSVLGIAFGVALGVAVTLINDTAVEEFSHGVRRLSGQADLVLKGPRAGFSEALYPWLARDPGVALASPAVDVQASLPGHAESLRIVGLDPFRATRLRIGVAPPPSGSPWELLDPNRLYLSPAAARWLRLRPGDSLRVQVGLRAVTLRVAGILPTPAPGQRLGVMDIAGAQWHFERLGRLDRVDLRLRPGVNAAEFKRRVAPQLPPGLLLAAPAAGERQAANLSRAYRVNLTVLSLIALFTGAFLVFATLAMAVLRRRAQLALLRVLGVTRGQMVGLLLAEGLLIGVLGALLGAAAGWELAALGLRVLGGDLGGGYFAGVSPRLQVNPLTLAVFFMLGVGVALLGAWAPAWETARTAPAAALKGGDIERALGRLARLWPGLTLLGLGALLTLAPPVRGLPIFGYLAIALLLLGVVLLLPRLLSAFSGRLPLPANAPGQIAIAQLRGAPGQAAVAVAAIVVSFSLMVAMAVMVSSFRDSVNDWLAAVLPADLYLRASQSLGSAHFGPADQVRIAATPGVARAAFLRVQNLYLNADKPPVALIARDFTPGSPRNGLPLVAAYRLRPGDPPPVYVSEALRDLYGMRPGERVVLPIGGKRRAFTVAGVWRDYARQWGSIVMQRALYAALTGDRDATDAALWLAPGADPRTVIQNLRRSLPLGQTIEIRTPGEIRRISLRIFDRSFAITYVLEAVAVLIGLFGIANGFSAQAVARRAEFGMLRHLGMDRGQILRMLALEAGLLSGLGVLLGLLLGGVVSLILIYVVNRQSFHWGMGLHPPGALLAVLSALLIAAAVLTATASARQVMRADVLRAVREE